jgi:hypothetical protein
MQRSTALIICLAALCGAAAARELTAFDVAAHGRELLQLSAECSRAIPNCNTCTFRTVGSTTRAICTQCATGYVVKASGRACCEFLLVWGFWGLLERADTCGVLVQKARKALLGLREYDVCNRSLHHFSSLPFFFLSLLPPLPPNPPPQKKHNRVRCWLLQQRWHDLQRL